MHLRRITRCHAHERHLADLDGRMDWSIIMRMIESGGQGRSKKEQKEGKERFFSESTQRKGAFLDN